MTTTELPFRATTEQTCAWLAAHTGLPWTLARLLEAGLTPYVWLDYDAAHADLFGDANGGYAAPIFFEGDIARLAAGSEDVLITITKDVYRLPATLPAPGFRRALHELRFLKKEVERLPAKLAREAEPPPASAPTPAHATESKLGIDRQQVLAAFAAMVKIDLEAALAGGGGIFGDDGARVKGSARKSKNKALWNPVTLALGLNEVYRVPIPRLKKAFVSHDFLFPWLEKWEQSLQLLGK
ncbi:MAG: hypothetical protein JWP72_3718 [Massilia sp.]|nr:hypothetical protein [Massilia sp.]MDB5790756.1 hypothetical protein [Massilia sp.]